jgi:hypothetical protein
MFDKSKYNKKYYSMNKERHRENQRRYRKNNPDKVRAHNLKTKYKLTMEQYKEMFYEQKGRCAICKKEKKLVIDHNHKTNKVRALLCSKCNTALGLFEEDWFLLLSATNYISKWR